MATITVHFAPLPSNLISTGVGQVRPSSSAINRMFLPGLIFLNVARLPSAFRQRPPSRRSISFFGPNHWFNALAVENAPKQSFVPALILLVGQMEYPLGLPSFARSPRAISYSLVMVVAHQGSTSCSCSIHLERTRRPRATPPCWSSASNHSA